jgi:hypothetical protein
MNRIGDGEQVEPRTSPMRLQEPPSPTTLKKKRKRASEVLGNGVAPTRIPQPCPETAITARHISHSRRKIGHNDPMAARALSPLRQSENDADGDVSDESLYRDGGPISPPLVRPQHQLPQLHSQKQSQHVERQASLAVDRTGSLHIAPPEKSTGRMDVKGMGDALKGLTVHIIHVKDTLSDGPSQGDVILGQLRERAKEGGLGCEFDVTSCGESIWV